MMRTTMVLKLLMVSVVLCLNRGGEAKAQLSDARVVAVELKRMEAGNTPVEQIQAKVDTIWSDYLARERFYSETRNKADYIHLARWSLPHLDKEQREYVRTVLRESILADRAASAAMSEADFYQLHEASRELDVPMSEWADAVHAWIVEGAGWQVSNINKFASARKRINKASGYRDMTTAKDHYNAYVYEKVKSDPQWLVGVGPNQVVHILDGVVDVKADMQTRESIRGLLEQQIYDNPESYESLGPWQLQQLRATGIQVGIGYNVWASYLREWVQENDSWQSMPTKKIVSVLKRLRDAEAHVDVNEAFREVASVVGQRSLIDVTWLEGLGADDLHQLVRRTRHHLDEVSREHLAKAVIHRLVYGDDLNGERWVPKYLATLYTTPDLRGLLQSHLLDDRGYPIRNVGTVLTWTYLEDEVGLRVWRKQIYEQANRGGLDGDASASWELICAEAALPNLLPADTSGIDSMSWAQSAIESAESDKVKRVAVEWYTRQMINEGRVQEAADFVQAQANRVQDTSENSKLAAVQQKIQSHTQAGVKETN